MKQLIFKLDNTNTYLFCRWVWRYWSLIHTKHISLVLIGTKWLM